MDLILWRHAEAFDGTPDLARRLTPKGHKQAAAIAAWLGKRLPAKTRILASPAARAQETGEGARSPLRDHRIDRTGAPIRPPSSPPPTGRPPTARC